MTLHATRFFSNLAVQSVACCLVLLLLYPHHRLTYELASKVAPGMTEQNVEAILGKAQSMAEYVTATVGDVRAIPHDTVLAIIPSGLKGPGLSCYTLHIQFREGSSAFTLLNGDQYGVWLSDEWSVLVSYDQARCVKEVYLCPTMVQPGNVWERIKWHITHWWQK